MLNQKESHDQTQKDPIDRSVFIKNFKKLHKGKSKKEILNDFINCYLECSELESLNLELEEKLNTFNASHIGILHSKPLLLH